MTALVTLPPAVWTAIRTPAPVGMAVPRGGVDEYAYQPRGTL
jgi:hypothetical protein